MHMHSSSNSGDQGLSNAIGGGYVTIEQAGRYLSVSRSTMYRLIRSGVIKVYRPTQYAARVSLSDLNSFIRGTEA